ncbi:hypothetical protein TNIN_299511 [Trichonephila inaurata madagascariensis]|uniref:Uncharacterized protein n=1 Tax=Trichonephila inaurata madagascariensis TaxID=2747483 RepID=A0A8X7C5L7_9ARAC|nr:hypothetical protein TNIN_299511 [Trichonephila inaurata madagascariensis]
MKSPFVNPWKKKGFPVRQWGRFKVGSHKPGAWGKLFFGALVAAFEPLFSMSDLTCHFHGHQLESQSYLCSGPDTNPALPFWDHWGMFGKGHYKGTMSVRLVNCFSGNVNRYKEGSFFILFF